jgi:hypothetical protein
MFPFQENGFAIEECTALQLMLLRFLLEDDPLVLRAEVNRPLNLGDQCVGKVGDLKDLCVFLMCGMSHVGQGTRYALQ